MTTAQIDRLAAMIGRMDRKSLIRALRCLKCSFDIDFSDEYLDSLSLERLQHILLSAALHAENPTAVM